MKHLNLISKTGSVIAALSILTLSTAADAAIQYKSVGGGSIDLYAKQFQMATPDGDSIRMWGFASTADGKPQYPAPTLRSTVDKEVQITVHNVDVPQRVSLVLPGQGSVTKSCVDSTGTPLAASTGTPGPLERCLANGVNRVDGESVTYTFTTSKPGTYLYQSGTNPQIQVDMGLAGALIVDPVFTTDPETSTGAGSGDVTIGGVNTGKKDYHAKGLAYADQSTAYDREYLFFLSETDPKLHYLAEFNNLGSWDNGKYQSTLYFINGRNGPDTLAPDCLPQLENQPYGALVNMHPGQRVLLRVVNVGRNQHPLHLHGNHFAQIARDGNLMGVRDSNGKIQEIHPVIDYTYGAVQGGTSDLIFTWTGKGLGWDMYGTASEGFPHGHGPDLLCVDTQDNISHESTPDGFDDDSWESCDFHEVNLPVVLPENLDLAFGGFWGGSPYIGKTGTLPVGEGGLNPAGGMVFMWHSHSERELTNNDIYPGGMLTMMLVTPYEEGVVDDDTPAMCN